MNEKYRDCGGFVHVIKNNIYMLKYIRKYAPSLIIWSFFDAILYAVITAVPQVVYVKAVFDALGEGTPEAFQKILLWSGLMVVFYLTLKGVFFWYWEYNNPRLNQILRRGMQRELFMKARSVDISLYDDPEFFDGFVWATGQADTRALEILNSLRWGFCAVLYMLTVVGITLTINIYIAAIILVTNILGFIFIFRENKLWFAWMEDEMPSGRRLDYCRRVFYFNDFAKEIRQGGFRELFSDEFTKSTGILRSLTKKYAKKFIGLNIFKILVDLLGDGAVYTILIYGMTVGGSISLGDFAAAVTAVQKLKGRIYSVMWVVSELPRSSLFVDKFRAFLEYEPKIKGGTLKAGGFERLCVNNLSFTYPGASSPALSDISLEIKKGEKIALVGYNGAGKSTLIKLIMYLYESGSGEILYNGTKIERYTLDSYRGKISAVFQDYRIFAASIAENVAADIYDETKEKPVLHALSRSGFDKKLGSLKDGINTQLTREFFENGTELSGGEAQKVAIARVFCSGAELLILDEPSSALDPVSEYELNRSIHAETGDKTVIFISHRLSTTRMADRIYMLDGGRIIEHGSHDELMKKGGKYAEMFTLQAEKYIKTNNASPVI